MSFQFWVNLFLSFCVLLFAVGFINRSKIHFIRRIMASRLRIKILPAMDAIIPVINASFRRDGGELFPLFKLKADLESFALKADVLFDVERNALAQFLTQLSTQIARFEAGTLESNDVDELVLSGQRVMREVKELA